MKFLYSLFLTVIFISQVSAQDLPHEMTKAEYELMPGYLNSISDRSSSALPPSSSVRTMAEWEELQGLLITWISYPTMLKEIVREAKQQCKVYIVTSNVASVVSYLSTYGIDTTNVVFLTVPFNSVWCRDYGPWSAYTNDVDSLLTIDWIYNRPRPSDDTVPSAVAQAIGTPLYTTTTAPWNLVHTGGNFMTDGFGTGFSSELIINENPGHTIAEIDTIMERFMGINRYIKMPVLPYDGIHHIDMHMKLLDEETLLIGEYPAGIADGPQIEANLQYILSNFNSPFGTPYKIIRIPMPADNGQYPNTTGDYLTYTNSSFINKTLIVPTYNIPADSTALNIYRKALPGYKVVGINSNASIPASGALHCITKEIGTADPMLISHKPLEDVNMSVPVYHVVATINHRSDIQSAELYYRTDTTQPYQVLSMIPMSMAHGWYADIPQQTAGSTVYYYIKGIAFSGKQQVRPLSAPSGFWSFKVIDNTGIQENEITFNNAFPNPSKGITCIPLHADQPIDLKIDLYDIMGRKVESIFSGKTIKGENKFFVNTQNLSAGVYLIVAKTIEKSLVQKLIVR